MPDQTGFDPMFGDPNLWQRASAGFAKGNLVANRHRYVVTHWGEDLLAELVGRLDEEAGRLLQWPPLPVGWHRLSVLARIDQALFYGPMAGDMAVMQAFGFEIADYDLSTLYKILFKVGSPGFIAGRLGVAYSTYLRDAGTMRVEVSGRTARAEVTGGVVPMYLCAAGITGWIEAALVRSGARESRVEHVACQHRGGRACVWELAWR